MGPVERCTQLENNHRRENMTDTIECPGCGRELVIGAAEVMLFRGLPLACNYCNETIGTIGPRMELSVN